MYLNKGVRMNLYIPELISVSRRLGVWERKKSNYKENTSQIHSKYNELLGHLSKTKHTSPILRERQNPP